MTDAPAWALGYDLAFLKQVAAVFARDFKPHCYGAFGLPKERDIATAMKDGQLAWTRCPETNQIAAAAMFRVAKVASSQSDFAQRTISIHKGDLQIRALAGNPSDLSRLVTRLMIKAGPRHVWIELHEENRQIRNVAIALGFKLVATKITASSDIKALYIHGEPTPSKRVQGSLLTSDIPALKLLGSAASPSQISACIQEINAYNPKWEQHYSSYNKRKSWTAIALQGFDACDPGFIIKPAEMSKGWKQSNPDRLKAACAPTTAAVAMPTVWRLANQIPGKLERVRLMRLRASNGELTRHADITDRDAGTANGRIARLHIPLQTAPGCEFSGWELTGHRTRTHFPAGSLFYLDIRKPHAVKNTSSCDRIHLVIDVACNAETRGLING